MQRIDIQQIDVRNSIIVPLSMGDMKIIATDNLPPDKIHVIDGQGNVHYFDLLGVNLAQKQQIPPQAMPDKEKLRPSAKALRKAIKHLNRCADLLEGE